jgi:hypothetical protein
MTNSELALMSFHNGYSKAKIQDYSGAISDFEKALGYGYNNPQELYINIASCHNTIAQIILQNNGNNFSETIGLARDNVISESQKGYNSIIKALEFGNPTDEVLKQCHLIAGMTSFRIFVFTRSMNNFPNVTYHLRKAAELGGQEAVTLLFELTKIVSEK